MSDEMIMDVAHLGHLEVMTPNPEESLHFFINVMGMTESGSCQSLAGTVRLGPRSCVVLLAVSIGRGLANLVCVMARPIAATTSAVSAGQLLSSEPSGLSWSFGMG